MDGTNQANFYMCTLATVHFSESYNLLAFSLFLRGITNIESMSVISI